MRGRLRLQCVSCLAAAVEARLITDGGGCVALAISKLRLTPALDNRHNRERALGGVTRA